MARHRTAEQLAAEYERKAAAARKRARDQDTRRKILLGSWVQNRMERNDSVKQDMLRALDRWLTRPADRRLFGLGPIKGLYGATLKPAPAGWSLGKNLLEIE